MDESAIITDDIEDSLLELRKVRVSTDMLIKYERYRRFDLDRRTQQQLLIDVAEVSMIFVANSPLDTIAGHCAAKMLS